MENTKKLVEYVIKFFLLKIKKMNMNNLSIEYLKTLNKNNYVPIVILGSLTALANL